MVKNNTKSNNTNSKNSNSKNKRTQKNKKTKGCGCKLPRFFGGKKTRKYRKSNKSKNVRKKQRGGNGLSSLVPSDINNLGRSIMYTFNKYSRNVRIWFGLAE